MSDESMLPSAFDPAFWGLSAASGPWRMEREAETAAPPGGALQDYLVDAWQRGVLFLDILRRRGDEQEEMTRRPMATVLTFDHEVLMSGRSLKRPINYSLSRIAPPDGVQSDPRKRPVVVVDPRAGQGPGIGGFKTQSEIGDALESGHPVYFIGFSARPEPGQTFLDVVEGQVAFFERIVELHPDAPRPFAIGNCQAGYQTLMVAMLRPDLFGPCMAAGSPMSYWQGVRGENPMRYMGGLVGGSWLTALLSDLGHGKFDGAWLILNFDELNPANWLWGKQYAVYSAVDTEGPRYLGFEKWWGDFVELNGGEIQYLVDELFIGDKLARNELRASDDTKFDLRNIASPIIVFTSLGDNISPPQQTLGWIVDLYEDVDEIRAEGRTIVYCLDQKVGHLAIFVSAKVGAKEDEEMVRLMDVLDCLPPGLYELVISPVEGAAVAEKGEWRSSFEMRTLDDIRALGRNSVEDDRAFAAAKRLSDIDHALYCAFFQPTARALAGPRLAELLFALHPLRLSYSLFSDRNPFMRGMAERAEEVKAARRPVEDDNPFLLAEKRMSEAIVAGLDAFRDMRDRMVEQTFFAIYGAPALQAALGLSAEARGREPPGVSPQRRVSRAKRLAELRENMSRGGFDEALTRAALFVISAERTLDDRCVEAINVARQKLLSLSIDEFKALVREQYGILLTQREASIEALPALVADEGARRDLLGEVTAIVGAGGEPPLAERLRLEKIATILGVSSSEAPPPLAAEDIGFRKTRRRAPTSG